MNNPGSTVYVRWYGKVLQGTVINPHDLMGMVAVSIPVQGVQAVALFTPAHVYPSPEQAADPSRQRLAVSPPAPISAPALSVSPSSPATVPAASAAPIPYDLPIAAFLRSHWDHARNHLRTDALSDFYSLWKEEFTPFGFTEGSLPSGSVDTPLPSPQAEAQPQLPLPNHPNNPSPPTRPNHPKKPPIQLSLFD